jgi:hypothetical protein
MRSGTAQAGHYFSHCKRDNGEWVTLNDRVARHCDGEALPEEAAGGTMSVFPYPWSQAQTVDRDSNAYLLFYRKRGATDEQSEDDEDAELQIDPDVLKCLVDKITGVILHALLLALQLCDIGILASQITNGNQFLYSLLMLLLRNEFTAQGATTLANQMMEFVRKDEKCAEFVIGQIDGSESLLF